VRTWATGSIAIAVNQQAEPSAPIAPASSDTRQARNTSITTSARP
jgi:hypothetical protein